MVGPWQRTCVGNLASLAFTRSRRLTAACRRRKRTQVKRRVGQLMNIAKLSTAVLLFGALVGCMVGPKYHRPGVPTPNAFRDLAENPQVQTQTASYADLS